MNIPLSNYLMLSAFLFAIGLCGALSRKNAIIVLMGIDCVLALQTLCDADRTDLCHLRHIHRRCRVSRRSGTGDCGLSTLQVGGHG
jgi:hypothetical protein